MKLLTSAGIPFDREVHISYRACGENDTYARLDFVIYTETHIIIVSVDEFQHLGYPGNPGCDVARMTKVVHAVRMSGDQRPILWLRINPDYFSVNGQRRRVSPSERGKRLIQLINKSGQYIGNAEVKVYYLYYDCCEIAGHHVPEICLGPDYSPAWRQLVGEAIYQ